MVNTLISSLTQGVKQGCLSESASAASGGVAYPVLRKGLYSPVMNRGWLVPLSGMTCALHDDPLRLRRPISQEQSVDWTAKQPRHTHRIHQQGSTGHTRTEQGRSIINVPRCSPGSCEDPPSTSEGSSAIDYNFLSQPISYYDTSRG